MHRRCFTAATVFKGGAVYASRQIHKEWLPQSVVTALEAIVPVLRLGLRDSLGRECGERLRRFSQVMMPGELIQGPSKFASAPMQFFNRADTWPLDSPEVSRDAGKNNIQVRLEGVEAAPHNWRSFVAGAFFFF